MRNIETNVKYLDCENKPTIAIFGEGKIQMINTGIFENNEDGKEVHLLLKYQNEPQEMNKKSKHGFKTIQEVNPEIVLIFKNTECVDSLIAQLQDVKKQFKNTKTI